MEATEFLSELLPFLGMNQGEMELLVTRVQLIYLPYGPVFRKNDPSVGLYIIKSGAARVSKSAEGGGAEAVLNLLGSGSSFGEIGIIDGLPRTATVSEMQPTECYFLGRDVFLEILGEHPEIAVNMLMPLAAMFRTADDWIARAI